MAIGVTEIAALWGAIISSGLLGWTIYKDVKDTGKVRVDCGPRHIISPGDYVEEDVINWKMTNVGSKPVMITGVGGMCRDGKSGFHILDNELPKMLSPGEYHITTCREFGDPITQGIKTLEAFDSLGRRYRASKKDVLEVTDFLKRMREKGQTSSKIKPVEDL